MAIGRATQRAAVFWPIARMNTAPIKKPAAVPTKARRAVAPVEAALVRSTERVPRTTQNPC